MGKIKNTEITEKEKMQRQKDQMLEEAQNITETIRALKKEREALKDDIDKKLRERTQHTKELKKAEDDEHNMDEEIVNMINKLKKIEN